MATKFSDFTAQAATGTTFVVGYDGTTNTQYSQDNLTNFVLDGTLSSPRTLKLNSNNLIISSASGFPLINTAKFSIYPNGNSTATSTRAAFSSGNIDFNYLGHNINSIGLNFISYNTSIRAYGFGFYGGGAFTTNGGYSVIGPDFTYTSGNALTARLGVIGKHNDNTSYAFRVQNSDFEDMFSVRNDGAFALGKGASYTNSTPNTSVIIGTSALVTSNNSVVIGASATTTSGGQSGVIIGANASLAANNSFGVAIGANANVTGTNGTAIGYSSKAGGNGLAIGRDAEATGSKSITLSASGGISQNTTDTTFDVYMSNVTTPDFRVIGNEGMIPPSITTTVRNAISSPVTGSTIYNTTDNKLQFYNGTAWTDAAGSADTNIYNTDGVIASNRLVTLPTGSGALNFRVKNVATSKVNIGYEAGYGSISINPARPIVGSVHRIEAAGIAMLSKYTAGNTLWFGNEGATNNSYGFNMGGAPNGLSTVAFNIRGQGTTNATTALLVEDSSGNDIIKALDDRTVRLGYNANQITTEIPNGGKVRLNNISGDPLFSAGIVSGSTGKINVYGGYYNTFEYAASKGLVFTNEAGFHVTQDTSSMLTCVSSTKGFLPPRMTTTQRDAINSGTFTTGLTLYNTTDNKLQFYNGSAWTDAGGGGDNIYTANGTLTGNRTITIPANGNITFSSTGGFSFYVGQIYMSPYGEVRAPSAGRFKINSFNTELRRNFLKLYGGAGACLNGTVDGYLTISSFGNADPSATYSINARLGVVGRSSTSTTDYAFRVQDSAAADMLTLRDDGNFTLGKSAVSSTPNNVVIGGGATDTASSNSFNVIIGKDASITGSSNQGCVVIGDGSLGTAGGGVAVGSQAKAKGLNAIAIGQRAQPTGANSITLDASGTGISAPSTANTFDVFMTSASAPDLKFRTGDNVSYWNPSGETSAFGFSTTSPTATVDINGTFRLRAATNVSNQILTADSNGNATWSDSINVNGQVKGGYESGVTTLAFDWDNGNIQKSSATGAQTFSGANAIAGSTYIIMIGTPTVTWGSSVKWPGATAPTLAGTTNIITLLYDGTSYYATSVLNYS